MSKQNQQTPKLPLPVPMPWTAAFNAPIAASMAHSMETFAKGMEAFNGELSHFVGRRLREDAQRIQECAACDSFENLVALNGKWLSDTQAAYAEQGGRLMALSQQMVAGAADSAMEAVRNGYEIAQQMQAEAGKDE